MSPEAKIIYSHLDNDCLKKWADKYPTIYEYTVEKAPEIIGPMSTLSRARQNVIHIATATIPFEQGMYLQFRWMYLPWIGEEMDLEKLVSREFPEIRFNYPWKQSSIGDTNYYLGEEICTCSTLELITAKALINFLGTGIEFLNWKYLENKYVKFYLETIIDGWDVYIFPEVDNIVASIENLELSEQFTLNQLLDFLVEHNVILL